MAITSRVGLVSGIDYESIISQISQLGRRPISLYENRQSGLQGISEAYGTVSTQLTALQDQLKKMLTQADLTFRSATSSGENVLGVSADPKAQAGSYSVEVLQLAQSARLASQGYASADSTVAAADTTIQIGVGFGALRSYDVTATTTLSELRDMINQDSESGVRASIINDGSPSNPFRLVLTAKQGGAENSIQFIAGDSTLEYNNKTIEAAHASSNNTFNGTVTSSGLYTGTGTTNLVARMIEGGAVDGTAKFVVSFDGGLTFDNATIYNATSSAQQLGTTGVEMAFGAGTTDFAVGDTFRVDAFDPVLAEARDAVLSVDGIRVSRTSNSFSDVVDGLSFTALSVGKATATVEDGRGLLNAEIVQFQNAYNSVVQTLNQLTAYDTESKQAQALFGESSIRGLRGSLASIITTPVGGLTGEYRTLASLGMTLNPDGTLKFSQTKMNEAFDKDINAVMRIFARMGSSGSNMVQLEEASSSLRDGSYRVAITRAASQATVNANQALVGALADDELLTFTVGEKTFFVNLTAGQNIDQAVAAINGTLTSEGAGLTATHENGRLSIKATEYGSDYSFAVRSSKDGALSSQLGLGTSDISVVGEDVAGTINGVAGTGKGQFLSGVAQTSTDGLKLRVTATEAMETTLTYASGVADRMNNILEGYLNIENGFLKVKRDGLASSIENLNKQITRIEGRVNSEAERLRAQFRNLESIMAQYQNIGDYLSRTLSTLNTSSK
jgi:flagellar hook-associated protein 2